MNMNKINLSEGLSNILYHFTYIPKAINILKTNQFITSSALGTTADANKNRGKFFYFSTQRSGGKSGYGKNHGDVIFVLDGQKLNQNFKGFPTDYWNWSKKRSDYDNKNSYKDALLSNELEDRIVTDKPYIDDAKKYILELHVFFATWYANKKELMIMDEYARTNGIPIYFYDNIDAFRLMNKKQAVDFTQSNHEFKEDNDDDYDRTSKEFYYAFGKMMPYILINGTPYESEFWNILYKFLESKNEIKRFNEIKTEIIKKATDNEKLAKNNYYGYRIDDVYNSISADFHNAKSSPDPFYREFLRLLVKDIRNNKSINLKEYLYSKLIPRNKITFTNKVNEIIQEEINKYLL